MARSLSVRQDVCTGRGIDYVCLTVEAWHQETGNGEPRQHAGRSCGWDAVLLGQSWLNHCLVEPDMQLAVLLVVSMLSWWTLQATSLIAHHAPVLVVK